MSAHSVGCVTMWPRSLLLLAALPWGLLSEALASTDNTLQNRSSAAVRVAVLLPGELRFPDAENLQASMAAFDVFISTYVEYEDRAHMLRPKRIVLTDRSTVSLPGGRMYQWYHLDRLLKEYKAELLEYDVLFKTRSDCYFFEPLTAAHFSHVHGDFLHMNSDHSFYARAATFFNVYESMFDDVRGKYLRAGHVYFDLDYENLVVAYRIDAVNKQHVHTKRHPTIRYRFTRINLAIAARQLVYPTSVYHRSTKVLIENIESHLRAGLPIDNGKYTNRNLGDNTFASEKFHLVHAINRAPIADFALPTFGVLFYGDDGSLPPPGSLQQEPNVAYGIDDTPTSSAPKRHLLLWHLQKGGGTQVLAWLRKLKLKVEVSPERKAPIRPRFRAPSYFRIGLIREPCDYHASEYLWGRRHKLSEAGLGLMRYALEGQGLGYLYETANVAAGFKTWLKYTHHQLGPEATRSCGVLGARLWTQVVNQKAAAAINNFPLNRSTPCVAKGAYWSRKCPEPCPIGDCMFQAPEHLRSACHAEVGAFEDAYPFDCWLRTDRLADDFVECLVKYDSGLGPRLEALMRDRNQSKQVNHVEGRMSCAQMHDDETAELVYRLDGDVAKLFGYTAGCCRPHPNSQMPRPVLITPPGPRAPLT